MSGPSSSAPSASASTSDAGPPPASNDVAARPRGWDFPLAVSRGIDATTTAIGMAMWWVTLFMVVVGFMNVVGRNFYSFILDTFGSGVAHFMSGSPHIALQTYGYDLVFLLGAAYVFRTDAHVRVDVVFSQLPYRVRSWIDIGGILLFLFPFCWLGLFYSQSYIGRSWASLETSMNSGLPIYPIKTVIVVAFVLLITQSISELIKHVAFLAGHPNSRSVHALEEQAEATRTVRVARSADADADATDEAALS